MLGHVAFLRLTRYNLVEFSLGDVPCQVDFADDVSLDLHVLGGEAASLEEQLLLKIFQVAAKRDGKTLLRVAASLILWRTF
jgi:hypothetical protein